MTTETPYTLNGDVVDLKNKWEANDKCRDESIQQSRRPHLNKTHEETERAISNIEFKLPTGGTSDVAKVVEETGKRHVNTYKIRFEHGDSRKRRESSNRYDTNVPNKDPTENLECLENTTEKLLNTDSEFGSSPAVGGNKIRDDLQKDKNTENEGQESPKKVKEDTEQVTEDSSWSINLPLLPEMQGSIKTKSSHTKAIRSLSTSKSSNWVLVGLNGKRHLRRPSPFPKETFPPLSMSSSLTTSLPTSHSLPLTATMSRIIKSTDRDDAGFSLPRIANDMLTKVNEWGLKTNPIANDMLNKVNEWGFKTNPMTFSALLEVDHRKACLRDNQTVEFGKELGMLLKTRKDPEPENSGDLEDRLERIENDVKCVEKQTESEDQPIEHTPSTPIVILTPVPPATNEENVERSSDEKEKARRHTTCSRECGKKPHQKDDIEPKTECHVTKKSPHETESCKQDKNTLVDQSHVPGQGIKKSKQKKKRSSLRKSKSTLPETLVDTSSFEKLPKLPDEIQYVFDEMKDKRPQDSKRIVNANKELDKSFTQNKEDFNDNERSNISDLTNDDLHYDNKKTCIDLKPNERSDSIMRERLADNMDFECTNDSLCTFEDDDSLQRAVVLRNRAFHPQTTPPPSSPLSDRDVSDCSYIFNKQNTQEWQDTDEVDDYLEPSRTISFMDKLRPTLCDLERLLSKNIKCASDNFNSEHGEISNSYKDIKQSKSVRFADLPPRRKREPSRSLSDPTNDTSKALSQGSAEWNECFLVAVGENRTIRKEVSKLQRQQPDHHQGNGFKDDADDELGQELIEREMKRYIHWLRHDRAADQHRWFSSNVSHRNFPISTHQVPSQHSTIPYGISVQTSNPSISAKIAKNIGLYSVLPKPDIEGPPRSVRFPKVPVLPPIAGGSNEVLFSKTFTGEVKGLPIGGRSTGNKRYSTGSKRRRGGIE